MGAAHCAFDSRTGEFRAKEFFVAGHPIEPHQWDRSADLILWVVTDGWRVGKELKISKKAPKIGDFVETLGYAMAGDRPSYFAGFFSFLGAEAQNNQLVNEAHLMNFGGQSGSPAVNKDGKLVGMLNWGYGVSHLGVILSSNPGRVADPIAGLVTHESLVEFGGDWVYKR
jgi:hypothetical protein